MGHTRGDEGDLDATIPGGSVSAALPFDPRPNAPLVRSTHASRLPTWSGTVVESSPVSGSATPFAPRASVPPPAAHAPVPAFATLPPAPAPVRSPSEPPSWMGMHADPTRRERIPSPPPPPLPIAELHSAAREGAFAASNAALNGPSMVKAASRVRFLEDDEGDAPRFEPIDVLFAPTSVVTSLRQVATTKRASCCGSHRLAQPGTIPPAKDERAAAHHAMCHAIQRSSQELHQELTQALVRGEVPPTIAIYGALTLVLDELPTFRATLALARAFLSPDPSHAELIAQATRVDEVADDLPTESLVHVRHRLEEALRRTAKGQQLELSRDRTLIERRKLAETQALGERRLRAQLRVSSGPELPCFLPIVAAASLPIARTFSAVLVATVRSAPDPSAGLVGLDVLAIGRPLKESAGLA